MTLDPWPFVLAAYAITTIVVAMLAFASWRAMRRAEAAFEASKRR